MMTPDPKLDHPTTIAAAEPVDVSQLTELEPFQRLASQRMLPAVRLLADNNEDNGNVEAWERWAINPRALVDVSRIDTRTTVLGREISLPVIVAPFALQGLCHPDGEVATAHGATRAGTTMALSHATTRSPADVGAAAPGFWLHLQFLTDRDRMADVIAEGIAAGASALCLTVDLPITPWWPSQLRRALQVVAAEGAATGRAGHFSDRFAASRAKLQTSDLEMSWDNRPIGASATWADLGWLREVCPVPVVLKGILTSHDARLAVEHGVDAIVVSNHGGHSLRQARPTAEALPEIVDAAADGLEVLVDGGIRTGADVFRAVALGARAVLIGRRALWGLVLGGAEGVTQVLHLLGSELEILMAQAGACTIDEIDPSRVVRRG